MSAGPGQAVGARRECTYCMAACRRHGIHGWEGASTCVHRALIPPHFQGPLPHPRTPLPPRVLPHPPPPHQPTPTPPHGGTPPPLQAAQTEKKVKQVAEAVGAMAEAQRQLNAAQEQAAATLGEVLQATQELHTPHKQKGKGKVGGMGGLGGSGGGWGRGAGR